MDSGVGGLSVLSHIRSLLPNERLIYLADQAHVPYGPRPAAEVCRFTEAITRFFLGEEAKMVVVACNTATAAALGHLRHCFPELPFVGMEPAVKPGAAQTRSGKVGVLATPGTFNSERYARLMMQYGNGVEVFEDPCVGLVGQIEAGQSDSEATAVILERALAPMLREGVDTVVLACTHYPFASRLIAEIAGPAVEIIDPAPAVARQVGRLLEQLGLSAPAEATGSVEAYTSGDVDRFSAVVEKLLGYRLPVQPVLWHNGHVRRMDG
jgi:glutamate racemase